MVLLNCSYCGIEVERNQRMNLVSCFDCKKERKRKNAMKVAKRQRAERIGNLEKELEGMERLIQAGEKDEAQMRWWIERKKQVRKKLLKFRILEQEKLKH